MLIIFGGQPGTGKSSISRLLARRIGAFWLRIDTLEQPIIAAYGGDIADVGYRAGYGVAEENLRLGQTVIADSVNPLAVTRDAWRAVANRAKTPSVEVEILCSDKDEHRRRVELREPEIPGLRLPTWREVVAREAEPWTREHIVVDTAGRGVEECVEELIASIAPFREIGSNRRVGAAPSS